jgi:hypothetical protein
LTNSPANFVTTLNYSLSNTSTSVAATITQAALTVRANDDARFVTQSDTSNFNGVGFVGLVNGETAANAVGSGPYVVTRPNTGTDIAAAIYSGALVPGALTSANYSLSYTNGKYTIVPAGQLLVRVTNNSNVYGSAAGYSGNSSLVVAQYLNGSNVITTLTVPPTVTGTNYAYNDGAGDVFNFNLAPFTSGVSPTVVPNSNAGVTPVGSWQMGVTGLSGSTSNFSGNLVVVGVQTVTPKTVSVNAAGVSKVYDGNTSMTGLTVGLSGLLASDGVTVNGNGAFSSKNAGPNLGYMVSGLQLSGAEQANYVLSGGNALSGSDGTITPKTVTLSANKVYDGTTNLAGAVTLNTGVSGESLSYSGATANSIHVATAANYINAISLQDGTGGLASNYQLPTLSNSTAPVSITAKTLSSNASIGGTLTKTYDGTTLATGATVTGSVSGAIAGDTLALDSSGVTLAYNNAHVANATTIAASGSEALSIVGSIAGSVASDYSFTSPVVSSATASITAKTLSPTLANTGVSKVYDGSTSAPVGFTPSYSYSGLVAGDTDASLGNAAAAYNSAHVANATTLTVSGLSISSITGSNGSVGSDYVLDATAKSVAASITAEALASSAGIGGTLIKVYDGSTSVSGATVSGSVSGAIAGDTLSLDTSGESLAYNSAHVANATQIAASGSSTFNISATTSASVASDYSFTGPSIAAATASISAKALTSSASIGGTLSKTYDGSTSAAAATLAGSVSGAITGDTLTLNTSGESLAYNSAHVASATQIAASGSSSFTIGATTNSSVVSDYSFTGPSIMAATAIITTKAITSSASIGGTLTKVYDGVTSAVGATVSGSVTGAVAGDTLTLNTSGESLAYNNAHVASASSIGATGTSNFTIGSTSNSSVASDYNFTGPTIAAATASITTKALTSSASIGGTLTKVYDGSNSATGATVTGSVSGAVAGDTLSLDTNAESLAYNSAHVASATQIAATGSSTFNISATTSASVASDYSFTGPTIAAATASITPRSLTASITNTALSKVYDGSTSAPSGFVPSFSLSGLVSGDTAAQVGYTAASYNSSQVLAANQLTLTGMGIGSVAGTLGSSASDYVLAANTQAVAASITPLGITAAGNAANTLSKVYDGSTSLAATTLALGGIVTGDAVSAVVTGDFTTKNVGTPLGYAVNNITLSGTDASNYSYTGSTSFTGTQGSITPRTLVVNWSAGTKVYDGNTSASVSSNDNRISGDVVGIAGSGAFVDKNVGQGKTVNVAGVALSGGDATNYVLASSTGSTTGTITRLDSVTWVGGGSGNWFDPANWAGGAVPDLSNVAHVIIPTGITVNFNATVVAPAESGPVNIDSLRTAGGALNQSAGTLNVGSGGIVLDSLSQSAGTLTSSGPVVLNQFTQSGGSTATTNQADFTVNQNFSQTGNGTLSVSGNAHINGTSGGVQLGNISTTGTLDVTAKGPITQTQPSRIVVDAKARFNSLTDGVQLASNGNDFRGGLEIFNNNPKQTQPVLPVLPVLPVVGGASTMPTTAAPALVFETASVDSQSSSTSGQSQGTTPGVVVEVGQASAEDQLSRLIQVFVPKDAATSGTGFAFAVPEDWQKDIADYGLQATRMDGSALPAWLKWDATTMRFVASAVPDGAFPLQLRITIGAKHAIVVIAERQQN